MKVKQLKKGTTHCTNYMKKNKQTRKVKRRVIKETLITPGKDEITVGNEQEI